MEVGDVRKVTVVGACAMGPGLAPSLDKRSDSGYPDPPVDDSPRSLIDVSGRFLDVIHARI